MHRREQNYRQPRSQRARLVASVGLCLTAAASMVGCESDSFLDPSVVGRWEHTPTIVPILDRIEVIERDEGDFVEVSQVTPDDLIPIVEDYEVGPGDTLLIDVLDLFAAGQREPMQRVVDTAGTIDVPYVGRVSVQGLTPEEVRDRIGQTLVDEGVVTEAPLITVQVVGQRSATFGVFGAVGGVGQYLIPEPDYRLLEALTQAGGVNPQIRKIRIIRQVPLTERVQMGEGGRRAPRPQTPRPGQQPEGTDLRDLIEELTAPEQGGGGDDGSLSVLSSALDAQDSAQPQRREQPARPPIDLPEPAAGDAPQRDASAPPSGPEGSWMFLDGQWVQVRRGAQAAGAPQDDEGPIVTQRIIEVPVRPLLQGNAEYNIVIRPGDVIHVPMPDQGVFYVGGPGALRIGTYNLPFASRMTLKQAITASGGLGPIAIPERVDLIRRIGEDREATIRLNLRAIWEGTQPDVFLKPEDHIVVGTNFWATPLAVIRSGFRVSYGFGFLLDRNFGNDVFGAPPVNRDGF